MANEPGRMDKERSEILSNVASAAQALATIAALFIGGVWTYHLFIKQRQGVSQANVTHAVTAKPVSEDQTWVHIAVTVANAGQTIFTLKSGEVRVQQVLPLVSTMAEQLQKGADPTAAGHRVVPWPTLCYRETPLNVRIEPKEQDTIFYEFFVPRHVQTVKVYSYFDSETEDGDAKRLGRTNTSIHDIASSESTYEPSSTVQPRRSPRICSS